MRDIAESKAVIGRRIKPCGEIEYTMNVFTRCTDWNAMNFPKEYIASALLQELRRYVNSLEMKNVIMDRLDFLDDHEVCFMCGRVKDETCIDN